MCVVQKRVQAWNARYKTCKALVSFFPSFVHSFFQIFQIKFDSMTVLDQRSNLIRRNNDETTKRYVVYARAVEMCVYFVGFRSKNACGTTTKASAKTFLWKNTIAAAAAAKSNFDGVFFSTLFLAHISHLFYSFALLLGANRCGRINRDDFS